MSYAIGTNEILPNLLGPELGLQPRSETTSYAGVEISDQAWNLNFWIFQKGPLDEVGSLLHFEGIEQRDFRQGTYSRTNVDWNPDNQALEYQPTDEMSCPVGRFTEAPLGKISPELQEAFLIKELRTQILFAVEQRDWKALRWLKQHGVAIARKSIQVLGRPRWEPVIPPAIPFEVVTRAG
jgi:hypothetical protein